MTVGSEILLGSILGAVLIGRLLCGVVRLPLWIEVIVRILFGIYFEFVFGVWVSVGFGIYLLAKYVF